nr:zinc finger, CCHC-type, retrotransposon Gag domain protein [Tanacetum cinerariifolium]
TYRRRPFCDRSERLADIASPNSRRDLRGVPVSSDLLGSVGNKMHKAFPLPGESSHWQYKFPLPVEDFKKLFFLQFFPRAEQERLKKEYHSIRLTNTETSTKFMQRFLRLAGFCWE